ncbi:hypothetical protein SteCoe_7605 [Stentor coeruleus]|uniref:BRCT domain-containing protein n=1 Tax=Stentor coeruleus TaxID=5963 RepID=A0A1R2CMC7_9CILI|nr:hypothetical protein SteCoe_7605 [Stentor coeruleus]
MSSCLALFNGFKDDSEEEGEISLANEMDPSKFTANMSLTSVQLQKFLEHYTKSIPPETKKEDRFTKLHLNRINTLVHSHYGLISKDLRIFKLYKALIQLVTQDMHDWIDRDYHCGDVILEILKEVHTHSDNPWYKKLITKLRIEEIIKKQTEKSSLRRQQAENDRILSKRNRNYEKKIQKTASKITTKSSTKIDPFDDIPEPQKKLKLPSSVPVQEVEDEDFSFVVHKFLDDDDYPPDQISPTSEKPPQILEPIPQPISLEIENWYQINNDQFKPYASSNDIEIPILRTKPRTVDPRLNKYSIDTYLSTGKMPITFEKFTAVINSGCLVEVVDSEKALNMKIQVPSDSQKITINEKEYIISYRHGAKDIIGVIEKVANIVIFTEIDVEIIKTIYPGRMVFNSSQDKYLRDADKQLMLVFDYRKRTWHPQVIIPTLPYSLYKFPKEMFIDWHIQEINVPEILALCMENEKMQLGNLTKFVFNVFKEFAETKYEYAVFEVGRKVRSIIFENICIDVKIYEEAIGKKRMYTQDKLDVYVYMINSMGGKVEPEGKYQLVEEKNSEIQVSAKWVVSCYLNCQYMQEI